MKSTSVARPEEEAPDFADTVLRLTTRSGWSPAQLARHSDLDLAEVQSVLDGAARVPLDMIILLARALNVKPGALIDGVV